MATKDKKGAPDKGGKGKGKEKRGGGDGQARGPHAGANILNKSCNDLRSAQLRSASSSVP